MSTLPTRPHEPVPGLSMKLPKSRILWTESGYLYTAIPQTFFQTPDKEYRAKLKLSPRSPVAVIPLHCRPTAAQLKAVQRVLGSDPGFVPHNRIFLALMPFFPIALGKTTDATNAVMRALGLLTDKTATTAKGKAK